jgi:hypothetical protein
VDAPVAGVGTVATMHITRQASGAFVVFCGAACVETWLDGDPPPELAALVVAVPTGPGWCLHCYSCGRRCWHAPACPRCPGCAESRWTATQEAAVFGAELGRHATGAVPSEAFDQGERLCVRGIDATTAARVVLRVHRS